MNRNTGIIAVIIILLLIVGGAFWYTQGGVSNTATSTPTGTDNTVTVIDGTPTGTTRTVGAPMATTNSHVTPTDTTAVLVGGVIPNGAATSYWYEYGTASTLGNTSAKQNIGSGFAELSAPSFITGLTKDTTYSYRLVAQNSLGTNKGDTFTFHTTVGTPAPVGAVPTSKTLAATSVSRTSANINGQVTPNKAATKYWFEYGTTPSFGTISSIESVGDGSAVVAASAALANLAPATTYYFRLNAQNQFGTISGSILNFTTTGPAVTSVPVTTTQVASPIATTTATLRGTVNPVGSQTTYWFEYSTDTSLGSASLKTTPQKSAGGGRDTVSVIAAITGLQSHTTYYYRTVAQNAAGTVRGDKQTFITN